MNSEEFVDSLRVHVGEAAVEDVISNLKNPPGRRVLLREQQCSDWYNALSEEGVRRVNEIIASAVHDTLFGVLAVLDGARTISNEGGRFELTHVADHRVVLNDPQGVSLHELMNAKK